MSSSPLAWRRLPSVCEWVNLSRLKKRYIEMQVHLYAHVFFFLFMNIDIWCIFCSHFVYTDIGCTWKILFCWCPIRFFPVVAIFWTFVFVLWSHLSHTQRRLRGRSIISDCWLLTCCECHVCPVLSCWWRLGAETPSFSGHNETQDLFSVSAAILSFISFKPSRSLEWYFFKGQQTLTLKAYSFHTGIWLMFSFLLSFSLPSPNSVWT